MGTTPGVSSNVMSETAYFLQVLNESIESFKNECETSSKNHSLVYRSIGDIMAGLASLFDSIGFEDKSAEIRKMAEFLKKVVVSRTPKNCQILKELFFRKFLMT